MHVERDEAVPLRSLKREAKANQARSGLSHMVATTAQRSSQRRHNLTSAIAAVVCAVVIVAPPRLR
jgi:hypothetical protein